MLQKWFTAVENNDLQFLRENQHSFACQTNKESFTALMLAAKLNKPQVVELMVELEENMKTAKHEMQALMIAAYHDSYEAAQILKRYELNHVNVQKRTALMFAAMHASPNLVSLLIEEAGRVDEAGCSALSFAILQNKIESVKILYEKESEVVNISQLLEKAEEMNYIEIAKFIRSKLSSKSLPSSHKIGSYDEAPLVTQQRNSVLRETDQQSTGDWGNLDVKLDGVHEEMARISGEQKRSHTLLQKIETRLETMDAMIGNLDKRFTQEISQIEQKIGSLASRVMHLEQKTVDQTKLISEQKKSLEDFINEFNCNEQTSERKKQLDYLVKTIGETQEFKEQIQHYNNQINQFVSQTKQIIQEVEILQIVVHQQDVVYRACIEDFKNVRHSSKEELDYYLVSEIHKLRNDLGISQVQLEIQQLNKQCISDQNSQNEAEINEISLFDAIQQNSLQNIRDFLSQVFQSDSSEVDKIKNQQNSFLFSYDQQFDDQHQNTLLMYAAFHRNATAVQYLLKQKGAFNKFKMNALLVAVLQKDVQIVRKLKNFECKQTFGPDEDCCLIIALKLGYSEIVKELQDLEGNIRNKKGKCFHDY